MHSLVTGFLLAMSGVFSSPAVGADLLFESTGTGQGPSAAFYFDLPERLAPTAFVPGVLFTIDHVQTFFYDTTTGGTASVFKDYTFYTVQPFEDPGYARPGGFTQGDPISGLYFNGPRLFVGSVSNPTFKIGVFELGFGTLTSELRISGQPSPAPEPANWVTMILGFGAIGSANRYQRRKMASQTSARK